METVLITGCSSGIGRVSAMYFARQGCRVFATVRDPAAAASLTEWAGKNSLPLQPIHMDVANSVSIDQGIVEVLAAADQLDVLINNAGIAIPGAFEDMPWDALEQVMNANFFGALHVTRAVLPHMRKRGQGKIIMVSSLSALVGLPGMAAYSASKAALELAAESLRLEVDRFGISVSVIEPGAFNTAMPGKIAADLAELLPSPYHDLLQHLHTGSVAGMGRGDDPLRIAELLLEIIRTPRPEFRYAVGAQAQKVVASLKTLNATERDAFIRAVNATEWWSEGKTVPPV